MRMEINAALSGVVKLQFDTWVWCVRMRPSIFNVHRTDWDCERAREDLERSNRDAHCWSKNVNVFICWLVFNFYYLRLHAGLAFFVASRREWKSPVQCALRRETFAFFTCRLMFRLSQCAHYNACSTELSLSPTHINMHLFRSFGISQGKWFNLSDILLGIKWRH